MTVTNTAYTTNSYKVDILNELSSANIYAGVDTAIVALGWTQYDVIAATSFSPIVTYVYRVLNIDTSTYKYFIIRWDTIQLKFYTSTCESFNTSTNVATNECWTGSGAFPQGYDIKDCSIFVSATARHIVIWPFIKNEPGLWTAVFEFERVASEDTAGANVPCWAWTNSLLIGTPWGGAVNTTISQIMFAFPRTGDTNTGASAAKVYAPVTSRGMYPPSYPSGSLAITTDNNLLHLASFYNMTYGWDTAKTVVSPVAADAISKSMPLGRAYNVGVTKPIGSFLDSTLINGDSTGGWPSATGSSTEYVILPMNGGAEVDNAYATGKTATVYGTTSTVIASKAIAIGDNVWMACADGIRTWSMSTGQGGTTTLVYSNASGIFDIVFDGLQSIYGSTSTGIVKVDTESLAASTITSITGGTGYLGIDVKYVYATDRAASTTPKVYMILRSAFTVNAGQYTSGTALTVASGLGTPVPDYAGNCYVASQAGTAASQTLRLSSFAADTGTQAQNVANILRTTATTLLSDSPTSFYIDPTSGRIYLFVCAATSGAIYEVNTSLAALQTVGSVTTAATGVPVSSQMSNSTTTPDYRGDLNIVPIRGVFHVSPKKVALATATSGWCARIHWNYPSAATAGIPAFSATLASTAVSTSPLGYGANITNNGVRTFATLCVTAATDNRIYYINNYYNVTAINGGQAGRLLVKA